MNSSPILDIYRQHHDELIREAAEIRAAQEVLAARGYNPTLAWMGQRMVTLGKSLIKISGKTGEDAANGSDINLN